MAEHRNRGILVALALALGLVGVGWWLREPAPGPDARVARTAPAEAAKIQPAPDSIAPARPIRDQHGPLPPPGTPITQLIGPLQARADAGDTRAACRLALELLRCQHLEQAKAMQWVGLDPPDVRIARGGNLDAADLFAEMEIRKIQLGQQCGEVDPAVVAQAGRHLLDAARAGEPEAMLRYATGAHHGVVGQMGFIRDPDFERWRRDAPAMLLRAAQAGRMDAVRQLAMAYRSDSRPLDGLVTDDALQARAWALLDSRLWGSKQFDLVSDDAAIEREAESLARQWHQRYFNNAVPADKSALSLWPLDTPYKPLEEERFCQ